MTALGDAAALPVAHRRGMEVDAWTDRVGGLIERTPRLWRKIGDLETRLLGETLEGVTIDRPIYVTGLARSGSTILLEILARHADTATHRYRDFPLLFAPWAWNWFVDRAGRAQDAAAERAHADRIAVTAESPEAFEEVIWMAFFPRLHEPSDDAVLGKDTRNPRFEAFYRDHIRKLLKLRGGRRYVAKGNYNVTRLGYLKKLFPDAQFVIPIRDPLWHIASLMKQHDLFSAAGREDERIVRHLRRSGHFEFGPDRRAIRIGSDDESDPARMLWERGEEVAGWTAQWAAVYGHVADALDTPELRSSIQIVRYELLCADPAGAIAAMLRHCELAAEGLPEAGRPEISAPQYYQPAFTDAEVEEIRRRTSAVAARFGYEI